VAMNSIDSCQMDSFPSCLNELTAVLAFGGNRSVFVSAFSEMSKQLLAN
jgi:hypothetical protein